MGSSRHQQAIAGDLDELFAALDPTPAPKQSYATEAHVLSRARARERGRARARETEGRGGKEAAHEAPRYVALVNPNTGNGALSATAPLHPYDDPSEGALVEYLTANVFNGTGAHSFYKRVWGAGLAYSGYAWASPRYGRYGVYTDRCADPSQPCGPSGTSYGRRRPTRASSSTRSRAPSRRAWPTRTSRGPAASPRIPRTVIPPERVRAFASAFLALRSRPGLAETIHARLIPTFAAVLPTLPAPPCSHPTWSTLAIGPEPQLKAYEQELQKARGPASPGGHPRIRGRALAPVPA